ncbi:hypothetical protein BSLG_005536 [Batrachochytrium salamandrivorans]|nr:hypothetical protein BSLG_005536 [Batrachochytrium salamandrivorans]
MSLLVADYGSSSDEDENNNSHAPSLCSPAVSRKKVMIVVDLPAASSKSSNGIASTDDLPGSTHTGGAASKASGLGSLFAMLPAPKNASSKPASHHTDSRMELGADKEHADKEPADKEPAVRMLGQAAGDGSQPGLMISKPISRITNKKAAADPAPSLSKVSAPKDSTALQLLGKSEPPQMKPSKISDELDSDCYFTLDLGESASVTNAVQSADIVLTERPAYSNRSSKTTESAVVGDYEAYSAQFSGYGGNQDAHRAYVYPCTDALDNTDQEDEEDTPRELDDDMLRKLGHNIKKDGAVEIKEINHTDQMGNMHMTFAERNASLQGLPENSSFAKLGSGVISQGMKRRHNIMSLAHEARARQQSLEEQAANRKIMKKATRSKYGF